MRALLEDLFKTAVAAADPMALLPQVLGARPRKVFVIGAGKASARMAEALEAVWGSCEGLVLTRYGHGRPTQGIEILEAGHPVPDAAGEAGTRRLLARLEGLDLDTEIVFLLSGGASALLCAPSEGVTLAQKQALTGALLTSGAPIGQINSLRKAFSRVKGGRLAAAAFPRPILTLAISDVPFDDPRAIGSGPTVGEPLALEEVEAIAARWGLRNLPPLSAPIAPDDPRLSRSSYRLIAAPKLSLAAAQARAEALGWRVRILGDAIEGEAREVAAFHARLALRAPPRTLLLSGGELTVTRQGQGVGGPNAEYALALALALKGAPHIHALACDTDGIDGAAAVAGAYISPSTLKRGPQAAEALAQNDAHSFFAALGDQIVTGPTCTNVNDFRAICVSGAP